MEDERNLVAEAAACHARLRQIRQLPPGWLDGQGEPLTPAAYARAARFAYEHVGKGGLPPRFYPTPEGGISAEWTVAGRCIGLVIGPDGALDAGSYDPADHDAWREAGGSIAVELATLSNPDVMAAVAEAKAGDRSQVRLRVGTEMKVDMDAVRANQRKEMLIYRRRNPGGT